MKLFSAFLNLFLIIFSLKSFAAKLDFAQWLPYSVLSTELSKAISVSSFSEQNIALDWQDWKPTISSIQIDLDPAPYKFKLSSTGLLASFGDGPTGHGASLKVGTFNLDQTIVREFGGNQISLKIKATCAPFEIIAPAIKFLVQAPFVRSGNFVYPVADNVSVIFEQGAQVSAISCDGPMGFDSRISQLVNSTLQNPEVIEKFLTDYINKNVKSKIVVAWQQIIQKTFPELNAIESSDPMKNGIFLGFRFDLKVGPEDEIIALDKSEIHEPSEQADTPKLFINLKSLTRVVELKMAELKIKGYNLKQVPSFAKFMNSRLVQLFVWSDLLHYSRKAPFLLNLNQLVASSIGAQPDGQWKVKLQALGNIVSNRKGKDWNFIEWSMGLASTMVPKIEEGQLKITSNNQLSSLNFRYGKDYEERYSPGSPSKKVLTNAIASAVTQQNFVLDLPKLSLNSQQWQLQKLILDNQNVWIDWKALALP